MVDMCELLWPIEIAFFASVTSSYCVRTKIAAQLSTSLQSARCVVQQAKLRKTRRSPLLTHLTNELAQRYMSY
jgi:hypothetical protein